jgi:site-specific recombinase XerD
MPVWGKAKCPEIIGHMQGVLFGSNAILSQAESDTIDVPPVSVSRKRGKCMSRRSGQNPKVRVGKRANGTKYYYFQYWDDVPGQEERKRRTEVVGLVCQMTKSEAERKKREFIMGLGINSNEYQIPSSRTFADSERHYREVFAPRMLRGSTLSTAKMHIKNHLLPDWKDTPVEHITIELVNEWIWKKREEGLSWTTIKNILRTMQRVLSCSSKNQKPPFSLNGLAIPESDKLQMKLRSREATSFSWEQSQKIAGEVRKIEGLDARRERYATLFTLASASGLRCGELFALRMNDLNFNANTIRVDESVDFLGKVGPCKNATAYRTVLLADLEGKEAMRILKAFVGERIQDSAAYVFSSNRKTPLRASQMLRTALHPALKVLSLPQDGLHGFRRGCNRRWELSGMNPAVLRQQMGHTSAAMTARYTGEIPFAQVQAAFSVMNGNRIDVLENTENLENKAAA